jgi:hypothetical protein
MGSKGEDKTGAGGKVLDTVVLVGG